MAGQSDTGKPDPHSQEPAGSSTGGGGNPARDKAPVPTAQAPAPSETDISAPADMGAAGARGPSSGLQGGGMKPANERFAGAGRVGTPGAHAEPGSATAGQKPEGGKP